MTLSQTYISRKQLLVDNLVAKGVTGYTVNDGLTTLINAVLEIQGGGVRTLTLTSDKDILSYADSESATLTATLLEDGVGVSGATVEFFNGSTSLGTAQTDSNGVAVKTYTSTGAGDVSLKAEADNGMLVSKTYGIEDCTYYNSGTITGSQTLNIPNIPTNFKATYKLKKTGNDAVCWLNVGNDANNSFFFGQIGSDAIGIFKRVNGTNASLNHKYSVVQQNVEYLMEFTYNNGALTLIGCGQTLTGSFTETNRSFVSTNIGADNSMKELKIKPL
jgi:hypothetical protein